MREAESALAVAASKEAAAAARTEGAEVRLARERRRAELLERERDGLKRIVASYDAEREQAAAEGTSPRLGLSGASPPPPSKHTHPTPFPCQNGLFAVVLTPPPFPFCSHAAACQAKLPTPRRCV